MKNKVRRDTALYLLIALSAVLTPVYRILVNARIPVLALETRLVLAVTIVIAVLLGLALHLSGRRLRLVLLTAILFIHLDLAGVYTGLFEMIGSSNDRTPVRDVTVLTKGTLFLLIFGVIYTSLWAIRRYAVKVVAVYFAVIGLAVVVTEPLPRLTSETSTTAPLPAAGDTVSDTAPPLVVHILLDALLAPGAIDRGIAGGDAIYEAMHRLAERHGFRLFERAFSRHLNTGTSIANLMNAGYEEEDARLSFESNFNIKANAYFDDYAARGYRIEVYRNSSGVDYCSNEQVSSCVEFDSYNPVWLLANESDAGTLSAVTVRTFDLLRILLHGHARNYTGRLLARFTLKVETLLVGSPRFKTPLSRFDVQGFPNWFDDFADAVMRSDRGTLVFAHFLVPHAPFLLSSTCDTRESTEEVWDIYSQLGENYGRDREKIDARRKKVLGYYYAQVRCVLLKLEELLERIDRSERHRDALILVHGDHGPLPSIRYNVEALVERYFIDSYATFFAVRAPGRVPAGHDCEAVPLPDLFVRYTKRTNGKNGENGKTVTVPERNTVFVPTGSSKSAPVERPMPEFTCFHQDPDQ